MAEEMDRIVLRDADQREAESKRDAVNLAVHEADRGEAGERRDRERQRREYEHAPAPIASDQEHHQPDRRRRPEPGRFPLRPLFHQGREAARAP